MTPQVLKAAQGYDTVTLLGSRNEFKTPLRWLEAGVAGDSGSGKQIDRRHAGRGRFGDNARHRSGVSPSPANSAGGNRRAEAQNAR